MWLIYTKYKLLILILFKNYFAISIYLNIDFCCIIFLIFISGVPKWLSGEDDHYVAQSLYNFQAENADELSFSPGQKIIIAPRGNLSFL